MGYPSPKHMKGGMKGKRSAGNPSLSESADGLRIQFNHSIQVVDVRHTRTPTFGLSGEEVWPNYSCEMSIANSPI